jgi:drug/metabolite transporter (DMT)-like permease
MLPTSSGESISRLSESVVAGAMFSMSSITMILLNKNAMLVYPYSSTLLILQNTVTILLLRYTHPSLKYTQIIEWLPCAFVFCVNIVSSMEALARISVPTFTVFRNTQPIIAIIIDWTVRGEKIGARSVFYLFLVFFGACIYCQNEIRFNLYGYIWSFVHVLSMSIYSVLVKSKSITLDLTSFEMSLYNNVLSMPFLLIFQIGDFIFVRDGVFATQWHSTQVCFVYYLCALMILLSCIGSFAVSVAGFRAQKAMSPVSWLTLNNISKIPAILISLQIFGGWADLTTASVHGMTICMISAYLYALSRQPNFPVRLDIVGFSMLLTVAYILRPFKTDWPLNIHG